MDGLKPLYEDVVITPDMVEPSSPDMEVLGTLNPGGAMHDDGKTYLVVRVMEKPKEVWEGHLPVPHAVHTRDGNYKAEWDWLRIDDDVESIDRHSVVMRENEERVRPTHIDHFRVMRSRDKDGLGFEPVSEKPEFFPWMQYEGFGVEDPRITKFSGEGIPVGDETYRYFMTYVACSSLYEISTALAVTNNFKTFKRLPLENSKPIFTVNDKDIVIFPRKIRNPRTGKREYMMITRPSGSTRYMVPSMFIATSPDLYHWEDHGLLIQGDEKGHVGAGAPPVEVDEGWLVIYHQHRHRSDGKKEYIGTAVLLDKEDPLKVLKKLDVFMDPHLKVQREGNIDYVVFPSAAILHDDGRLFIYAGAADMAITVHIYKLSDVMDFMNPV